MTNHRLIFKISLQLNALLLCTSIASAAEQRFSTYPQFNAAADQELFDTAPTNEVPVRWLGQLTVQDQKTAAPDCAAAWLDNVNTSSGVFAAQLSQTKNATTLSISPVTAMLDGQARAVKSIASNTFLLIYRLVDEPTLLSTTLFHPLTTVACGVRNLHETSIGKIQEGWRDGNLEEISEGSTHFVFGIVTLGAAAESLSSVASRLGPIAGELSELQFLNNGAYSAANALALQPSPVLVGVVPVAINTTISTAANATAAGSVLVMYSVAPANRGAGKIYEMPASSHYKSTYFKTGWTDDALHILPDEVEISAFWTNNATDTFVYPGQSLVFSGLNQVRRGIAILRNGIVFDIERIYLNQISGKIRVVVVNSSVVPKVHELYFLLQR